MMVFPLVGCGVSKGNIEYKPYDPGSEYEPDMVSVYIKAEFQQELDNHEFTIEGIRYHQGGIINPALDTIGDIDIYLNEQGRDEVIAAMEHFETLNFVYSASGKLLFALNSVSLQIEQEYQQEFEEETFTIEDFEWDNIESIVYRNWYGSYGSISINLNEQGREQVIDAVEHFRRLNFVKDAYVSGIGYLD